MKVFVQEVLWSNRFFLIPCCVWMVLGGIMQLIYTQDTLFFAINTRHSFLMDRLNTFWSAFGRGDMIALVLCSLLLIPSFRNRRYVFTAAVFGILIPLLIQGSKFTFRSPRPLKVFGSGRVHTVPWLDNLYEVSFPSGHTLGAFGFFFLLSAFLPARYKFWSILFFLLALCCGYSRIYLGQHFFEDVYAGSLAGVSASLFIYYLGVSYFSSTYSK